MGDIETVDLESVGLLDADTIPNANQSLNCFSCGEDMNGVYCYACGNKNDNFRRSIWSLGAELFASLTAFEGKIWRSLRSLLFKPGKMAREYSDGARQKWTSPIRMFLATSLLLFGYVAISGTQLIAFGTKSDPNAVFVAGSGEKKFTPKIFFLERKSKIRELVSDDAISAFENDMVNIINNDENKSIETLETELKSTQASLTNLNAQIEDTKFRYAKPGLIAARDAVMERIDSLNEVIQERKETPEPIEPPMKEDPSNFENLDITDPDIREEINELNEEIEKLEEEKEAASDAGETMMNITGLSGEKLTLNSAAMRQAISIMLRQPERVNAPINNWLPKIMFAMMPFSMLMGAIFIRGRERAMLFDHLVHAAYIHSFSFLLLFFFILLVQFTPIPGLLGIYTLILLIYLPISAKRMFGRGWFKSFLTSYGVGFIYTFNMVIILVFLIGMGMVDIAKDVAVQAPA
ncbi:MAG: DUF3667 domain-containing protein [Hellea sp.]